MNWFTRLMCRIPTPWGFNAHPVDMKWLEATGNARCEWCGIGLGE